MASDSVRGSSPTSTSLCSVADGWAAAAVASLRGEDGGAVRDLGCGGDLAVGEAEARGAVDGLVAVDIGFALAVGGALDAAEDVGAQLVAGAVLPHPLGGGDRAERRWRVTRLAASMGCMDRARDRRWLRSKRRTACRWTASSVLGHGQR
ncbi:MAG: hypothetical protein ACXVHL_31610 [Solirubrobacteraceae bacterium]